jgi:hypothetical protein
MSSISISRIVISIGFFLRLPGRRFPFFMKCLELLEGYDFPINIEKVSGTVKEGVPGDRAVPGKKNVDIFPVLY